MTYLLDTSVFITSKQRHYDLEIFPGFWEWLIDANKRGLIASSDKVLAELKTTSDGLAEWAKQLDNKFFLPFEISMFPAMGRVVNWAKARDCRESARAEFLSVADSFLAAHALARGLTVVTFEVPKPASQTVIKIPDACDGLGVPRAMIWDVLRADRPSFVRGPALGPAPAPGLEKVVPKASGTPSPAGPQA